MLGNGRFGSGSSMATIDEVAIYAHALTAEQVRNHCALGPGELCLETSMTKP